MNAQTPTNRSMQPRHTLFGRHTAWVATALLAATLAGGCISVSHEKYTMNPDGSGKVAVELVQQLEPGFDMGMGMGGQGGGKDAMARDRVRGILDESKGIDAWTDVSFTIEEVEDNTYLRFAGTAYFSDLGAVRFHEQQTAVRPAWAKDGDEATLTVVFSPDEDEEDEGEDGEQAEEEKEEDDGEAAPPEDPLLKRVQEMEGRRGLRMMQAFMEGMYQELTFEVPGRVGKADGLEKAEDGGLSFVFDGHEAARNLEKLMERDAAALMETIDKMQVEDIRQLDMKMMNDVLGVPVHGQATIDLADEPLFDYEAEVEKAQDGENDMRRKVGL